METEFFRSDGSSEWRITCPGCGAILWAKIKNDSQTIQCSECLGIIELSRSLFVTRYESPKGTIIRQLPPVDP